MANLCKSARIWVRLHWTTETQVNVMVTLRDYQQNDWFRSSQSMSVYENVNLLC